MKKLDIIMLFAFVIFLIGIVTFVSKKWAAGGESEDWVEVCVHGQIIFITKFTDKIAAVNKLDNYGRPILCQVKDK